MTFKEKVYTAFQQLLQQKINLLQNTLADLKDSAANETKSTAGDKHETALAMLQIEQANAGRQLSDLMAQKEMLDKIDPSITPVAVVKGSLVKTNQGYLFLSAGLGKVCADHVYVIALSPQSPLGSALFGKTVNDSVDVNGKRYVIEEIK